MSDIFQILVNNVLTDIADLKVAQLKIELKKRGISTAGNKQDLYEKLKKFLENEKQQESINTKTEKDSNDLQNTTNNNNVSDLSMVDNSINETEITLNLTNMETNVTKQVEESPVESSTQNETKTTEKETNNNNSITKVESDFKQESVRDEKPADNESEMAINNTTTNEPTPCDNDKQQIQLNTKTETNSEASFSRDTSTERSESCIKELPMSGDRNRLSRSKSPKSRWHNNDTQTTSDSNNKDESSQENGQMNSVNETESTTISDTKSENQTESISDQQQVNKSNETNQETEAPKTQLRKRKWLNNDAVNVLSSKKSLTISSETLKSYLPPAPVNNSDSTKKEDENKLDNQLNGRKDTESTAVKSSDDISGDKQPVSRQFSRTVIVEEIPKNDNSRELTETFVKTATTVVGSVETEVKSEKLQPTSNVIHISNLTRPFTLPQLKELLSKYGLLKKIDPSMLKSEKSCQEHYFWINSVKSHCYVAFEEIESAGKAYEGLHNTTWPQSNPKQLQVTYSTMDELVSLLNSDNSFSIPVSVAPTQNKPSVTKQQSLSSNEKENETVKKTDKLESGKKEIINETNDHDTSSHHHQKSSSTKAVVREWDLPKYNNNSDSRYYSSKSEDNNKKSTETTHEKSTEKSRSSTKSSSKVEEPPKTLDDLFKKTTAVPHIYWLPLTEEQFIERQKEFERREMERAKRNEERQLQEAAKSAAAAAVKTEENNRHKRKLNEDDTTNNNDESDDDRDTTNNNRSKTYNSKAKNDSDHVDSSNKQISSSSYSKNRRKSPSTEPSRRRERSESDSS